MEQDNSNSTIQSEKSDSKEINHQENNEQYKMIASILSELINFSKVSNSGKNIHNASSVANSGNSDIDIKIHIDMTSIAFAILYSLFASKQLTSQELETAIKRLELLKQD